MDLNTIWFLLFAVLIIGYALLDGFDLGVGVLHLFTVDETQRRHNLNAIAPVWDGNEVWLLAGGGSLFAAFPAVYATVFSGFYLALMLVLLALIARAVSLEFRGKVDSLRWRRVWDWCFALGSVLPAILFGVAVGNILRGLPIDAQGEFRGTFLSLLNPFSILVGVFSLIMFTMHGAAYLAVKVEGNHRQRIVRWAQGSWLVFVFLWPALTALAMATNPGLFANIFRQPLTWVFLPLAIIAAIGFPLSLRASRYHLALLASGTVIASLNALAAIGLFPRLVPSSMAPAYDLTIYNAASSPKTLGVMLVIALIGMPLVVGYTVIIYRVFRGKVILTEESY